MLDARGARQPTAALRVDLGRRIRSVLFALRCAHSRSHILNPIRVRTVQCVTTSSGGALIQFVEHQSIQAEHRSVICSINRRSSEPTRTDHFFTEGRAICHMADGLIATGMSRVGKTSTGMLRNAATPRMIVSSAPTITACGLRNEKPGTVRDLVRSGLERTPAMFPDQSRHAHANVRGDGNSTPNVEARAVGRMRPTAKARA